ncbi:hypothetical protein [Echinicola jeungdonensis]|uniref:hypothetical protein n=1 Tax=Echinicola jeungdonensis TaxID=709343 RepID=UPI00338F63DE
MKKLLLFVMLSLPLLAYSQERSIGLRLGEPLGVTYKMFVDENFSLEGIVGRGSSNSTAYYRRVFESNKPTPGAFYMGNSAGGALSLHGRVAYNEDVTPEFDITEGKLLAYGGAGFQLRSVNVEYVYRETGETTPLYESRNNFDFGPEAYGGVEYYLEDYPVNIFAEIGLFMEVVDRPGHVKLQGE